MLKYFSNKCNYLGISQNINLTMNGVINNPNINWHWFYISSNFGIKLNKRYYQISLFILELEMGIQKS